MKKLPFILLICITSLLGIATFVEKRFGTVFALQNFYASWWMITLWASMLLVGLSLCVQILYKYRKPALLLHFAFAVILLGAFVTSTVSKRGQIHLREDGMEESTIKLPFSLILNRFEMDYYAGTTTPADYISHLSVIDGEKTFDAVVSMNNIFKYRGYRFYQASYDSDQQGTILSVSYDPFGIAITYLGYFLMVLSMVWILFSKHANFRKLLKTLTVITLLLMPFNVFAQRTLNKEEAKLFGELSMSYNGRIVPIDTYAHDFTVKITGKQSYKKFNAVQILAGWIFFPEDWQEEPMIKIKNEEIRQFINGDRKEKLRYSDFFNAGNIYKLQYSNFSEQHKGMREVEEKLSLIMAQQTGRTLTIFPQENRWYSRTDDLSEVRAEDTLFVSKVFFMIRETLQKEDHEMAMNLFEKLSIYQQKRASKGTISPTRTKFEIFYNRFAVADILYKINLTLGLIAFCVFIGNLLRGKKKSPLKSLFYLQLIVSFVLLTVMLGIRWYVSGHVPMSNGYETMMFVAWCILLITFLLGRHSEIIPAAGLLLSGFTLLVSSLGAMNPQITQLVPVLMSPWLSIHVSLLMVSYALLGFMMFNGLTAIVLHFTLKNGGKEQIEKLQTVSKVLLYPALFTLTVGIFVGAVWANVSWGRYWGWDPKEVWALITMLVYSLAMHGNSLPIFRKPMFFHVFTVIAFLTVLMTYFGVSWFLGGMHSY